MELLQEFKKKARTKLKRVVFPEGFDERVVEAAAKISEDGFATPIVVGRQYEIQSIAAKININLDKVSVIEPQDEDYLKRYASLYHKSKPEVSEGVARRLLSKNITFGAMMVAAGDADGMVGGISCATALVIQAAALCVGYEKGISAASSFFIMALPPSSGERERILIFADCAVNIEPTAQQLAEIAVSSARNAKNLLGLEPNVALLSFSTKGSAAHPAVDKVVEATKIAKVLAPELRIDGELQADAALSMKVAAKKVRESSVAGKANVLIFPDLNAGNIAYKLTQYLAGAKAYGPILQGFKKPVNDMSRGASVEDLIGVAAITAVQAQ